MKQFLPILSVEDDADDQLLLQTAFRNIGIENPIHFVSNDTELQAYLKREDQFAGLKYTPMPALIIMDLNLPGKNGLELLQEFKETPGIDHIPVVMFSTSATPDDAYRCYKYGCSGFFTKPHSMEGYNHIIRLIHHYWLAPSNISAAG